MISDHFPRTMIRGNDDDGVYYVRQLDAEDGVNFEGLIWFGQQFARHEGCRGSRFERPVFANVFAGRLEHGARVDENGERVDQWTGTYYDVPKGRICKSDDLTVESLVVPPNPDRAICDFPEPYLVQVGHSDFGGQVWGVEGTITGCWDEPIDGHSPPSIPPRIGRALTDDTSIREEVVALGSDPVASGFESSLTDENLTGTWRGDDGGSYYLTHDSETNDVVWYAESPDARPADHPDEARGWSNVFIGEQDGSTVEGFWADVPRGATRNAGQMELRVESPCFMRVQHVTGGYGGRRLWRVRTLCVDVEVPQLDIVSTEESRDEPLLYLVFFKLDGDSVDLDDLPGSSATVDVRPPIELGRNVSGTVAVPSDDGTFRTTLSTTRSMQCEGVENATRIGLMAFAIELDSGYSRSFREKRFTAWAGGQQWALDSRLRRGELPTLEFLEGEANKILVKYLGPWEGWPWGDPDDTLSGDAVMVSFEELENAIERGTGPIERELNFAGEGGEYVAPVVFKATPRVNPDCVPG